MSLAPLTRKLPDDLWGHINQFVRFDQPTLRAMPSETQEAINKIKLSRIVKEWTESQDVNHHGPKNHQFAAKLILNKTIFELSDRDINYLFNTVLNIQDVDFAAMINRSHRTNDWYSTNVDIIDAAYDILGRELIKKMDVAQRYLRNNISHRGAIYSSHKIVELLLDSQGEAPCLSGYFIDHLQEHEGTRPSRHLITALENSPSIQHVTLSDFYLQQEDIDALAITQKRISLVRCSSFDVKSFDFCIFLEYIAVPMSILGFCIAVGVLCATGCSAWFLLVGAVAGFAIPNILGYSIYRLIDYYYLTRWKKQLENASRM